MLYLFKCGNENILIIYKRKKNNFQQILWNLSDNTFKEGEWLQYSQLDVKTSKISPCGKYYYYSYNRYTRKECKTYTCVSELLSFKPILFSDDACGRYYKPHKFTENSQPIIYTSEGKPEFTFTSLIPNDFNVVYIRSPSIYPGYNKNLMIKKDDRQMYPTYYNDEIVRGEQIVIKDDIIYRNDEIIYNANENDMN